MTDSGAILLAFKLEISTVNYEALKHILTIRETPDSLLMIWVAHQYSSMWNENTIGRSPDHFSLCGKKMVWEQD